MAMISWRDQKMQIGATNWDHMSIGFLCHGLLVSMMWTCMMIMFVCPLDFLCHGLFVSMMWTCTMIMFVCPLDFLCHGLFVSMMWTCMMIMFTFIMSFTNIWVWWVGLWVALGKI
jgi:uncharacterized membrane protein YvlD (DUF360 family)